MVRATSNDCASSCQAAQPLTPRRTAISMQVPSVAAYRLPVRLRATTQQMTTAATAKAPHRLWNSARAQRPTLPFRPLANCGMRSAEPSVSATATPWLRQARTAAAPRTAATNSAATETPNGNGPTMKPGALTPEVASDHGASWIELSERSIAAPVESPTRDHGL